MDITWDEYFVGLLDGIRRKSKDKHTQHGCIIVGPNHEIRSTGYNSFPRGIDDNVPERFERPEKYLWMEHSERNAIFNAARVGVPLDGCTLYVSGIPCIDCCRAIIQCGIKTIKISKELKEKWISLKYNDEMNAKCITMLNEAGINLVEI